MHVIDEADAASVVVLPMPAGDLVRIRAGARAGTPRHPLLDPCGRGGVVGAGHADELDGGVVDMVGDGHALDELLEGDDLLAGDEFVVHARVVVGAVGVWSDQLQAMAGGGRLTLAAAAAAAGQRVQCRSAASTAI